MLGTMTWEERNIGWYSSSAPAVGKDCHSTLDIVHDKVAEGLRMGVVMREYSLLFQLNNNK